jgi:Fe-S oxidoreductase
VESILQRVSGQLQNVPGLSHQTWTADPLQCNHIWACRKAALPLLMGIPGNRKPIAFVEDTAVEPRRLPEFVARFRQILERRGTHGAFYGHASVGCLHIRPLIDTRHREELQRMEQILQEVSDLVLEFGGSMSGEHGDGLARSFLNEKLFGSELYQAFQQIKAAFDPQGRMNPGKVVDGPSPVENLRHPPEDAPAEIHTRFDYGGQGGFVAAVELCNGSALCRRNSGGTMCPSYMATRDEEHSTRGRANALRTVLSGRINNERIDSDRLYQTMELCLQCKGCKAECPTNVDVAKLKSEFLNQYYEARGTPLGVRAMGHVWRTNRIGSALAPFSNLLGRTLPAAWLLEKLGHVDRRRPLPRFHRQHFRKWFRRHVPSEQGTRGEIVLLDDCLTNYCEPGVNRAAVQVLEAVGYRVRLAPWRCCGRALISKGMLDEAQRMARENVGQLDLDARQGIPIVGCEPSCVSAVTDDYRDLVPGVATDRVAASTSLIEAHLVKSDVPLAVDPGPREIVLHGHCHQKALVGTADTVQMLSQIPEARVMALDSGCCGMAGSFGYEQYDLSMQIAELVLLPAVRTASPEAAIAAGGFSCRHQIEHGTGRVARHPIEVLAQQWRPSGA